MKPQNPRVEINLNKIQRNVELIVNKAKQFDINVVGVTKAFLAEEPIMQAYLKGGIKWLADSRIENIEKIRRFGFKGIILLLRLPMISEALEVVNYADVSLNSELETLKKIDEVSKRLHKIHGVILMVDVGDRREGILPEDLKYYYHEVQKLKNLKLVGLGLNVGCFWGVLPTYSNAKVLLQLKEELERKGGKVPILSGGSTCGLTLLFENEMPEGINQLRVGEGFLLGQDSVRELPIPGAKNDAFKLSCEIIEIKKRPSNPAGEIGSTPTGDKPDFMDKGNRDRAILALGRQDVIVSSIRPVDEDAIIEGASSDHLIVDITNSRKNYKVGDEMKFYLSYGGIFSAMNSYFIKNLYLN
ncbi:alanine/ornithine racemase family PLP-dependent enzyme [Natranaerofaba carboxydovora]|uniref:alanine/ornithine racemase family PLP-dependent enzyme n=1 Tax=Natranaerofaba carboxydovora TaxID=2742683 RepID=UPI001F143A69|nr:alanine/ornithine racemase family PLP-dependent enzyme [Natranaerofaba carboxydovora]UMZ73089.1 Ornithine racemase [Natranaerofaba carboxydovora]